MPLKFLLLELLSPLFYASKQDSGAAGSTTTDPWVGDIALDYAINASLGLSRFSFSYSGTTPHYEDILKLPYIASVAVPVGEIKYTQVYDTATSFISQGYFNLKAMKASANAPFRNWLKRQGLAPGNKFIFALALNEWVPPERFTVRLGNMKECTAYITPVESPPKHITINIFTLMLLYNNVYGKGIPSEIVQSLQSDSPHSTGDTGAHLRWELAQYIFMENVDPEKWISLLIELWNHEKNGTS